MKVTHESDTEFENDSRTENESLYNSNESISIAFTAGKIENRILTDSRNQCNVCAAIFKENDKLQVESFPIMKNCQISCRSTIEICQITHGILENQVLKKSFNYSSVMNNVQDAVSVETMFTKSKINLHSTHKEHLINRIVDEYISIRAAFIARKATLDNQIMRNEKRKKNIRNIMHFQGR